MRDRHAAGDAERARRASCPASCFRQGDSAFTDTDRWGDYTTTVLDPRNDKDLWSIQMYSRNRAWQTVWAKIEPPPGRSRAVRK